VKTLTTILSLLLAVTLSACSTTGGKTPGEKRTAIQKMKRDTLADLYAAKPSVQAQITKSAGYGVFSNANIFLILASFGGGYGVVENSGTGAVTYMKMGEAGIGFGAGAKDYRIVMVFHTLEALEFFVEQGWTFGGQADAAAKAGDKGGAVGGEVLTNNITTYQITEAGLALQATIKGTKFWKDASLN
jgi:lipid-binding SYLF domain-containing protein